MPSLSLVLVPPPSPHDGAATLTPTDRQQLAVAALAGARPITDLATHANVSRKFVYHQAELAEQALTEAFQPPSQADERVLFWLPVTPRMIRMIILVLLLRCHSSYRGVVAFFRDVFDYKLSVGTVHNVVGAATTMAPACNRAQDLSGIRVGALDEIFQGDPVLVGVDPQSTYCFLLAHEQHRDATTWGVHLLDLAAHGLDVAYTIADAGKGLRAGQAQAWPNTPCWGDIFHPLYEAGRLTAYLTNRALGCIGERDRLERKMTRAKQRGQGQSVSKDLALARQREAHAVQLADDLQVLVAWLRDDILCFQGPDHAVRQELFDFVVAEMRAREHLAPHRITPIRKALAQQRDDLLAFTAALDQELAKIAAAHQVPVDHVRQAFELQRLSPTTPQYWERDRQLWRLLGDRYHAIQQHLAALQHQIVRASSMVENLNRRLRCYFFLRREVGPAYLELLRFFLNHHRYPRSRKDARAGKSPAEILSGTTLPHWLEQLGFTRFRQPTPAEPMAAAA